MRWEKNSGPLTAVHGSSRQFTADTAAVFPPRRHDFPPPSSAPRWSSARACCPGLLGAIPTPPLLQECLILDVGLLEAIPTGDLAAGSGPHGELGCGVGRALRQVGRDIFYKYVFIRGGVHDQQLNLPTAHAPPDP